MKKAEEKLSKCSNWRKTIQLPVVDEHKVVGILDLFVFLDNVNRNISITDLMGNRYYSLLENIVMFLPLKIQSSKYYLL